MLFVEYKVFTFKNVDGHCQIDPGVYEDKHLEWFKGVAEDNTRPSDIISREFMPEHVVIQEVYADTAEFEYILRNFSNIPFREDSKSCVWTGEMARFIVYNL